MTGSPGACQVMGWRRTAYDGNRLGLRMGLDRNPPALKKSDGKEGRGPVQ